MSDQGLEIRRDINDRAQRRSRNIQGWLDGQGAKIRAARPPQIFNACMLMALDHCRRPSWRMLSSEQIKVCAHRAISQERVRRYGELPEDGAAWWTQISAIAAEWNIATTHDEWASKKIKQQEAA